MSDFVFNFPAISLKVSERKQIEKIMEEFIEFLTAKDEDEKYREWADFLNCCETYMRTQMNFDKLNKAREFVIKKNRDRGYYAVHHLGMMVIDDILFKFNLNCNTCIDFRDNYVAKDIPEICPTCGCIIKYPSIGCIIKYPPIQK